MSEVVIMCAGDIFRSKAQALVNPVDCTGAQGKGLALQFKRRFPLAASCFKDACQAGEIRIGNVFLVGNNDTNRTIVFFPTKRHWRMQSMVRDVAVGLADMRHRLREIDVRSVAIPALGCGEGGLEWGDVLPLINVTAEQMTRDGIRVEIYPPWSKP